MKREKLNLFDWIGLTEYYCVELLDYTEKGKWDLVIQTVWELATTVEMASNLKIPQEIKEEIRKKARETLKHCVKLAQWKMIEEEEGR
ncbi:MAG: hypothetical protein QW228_08640 [Candidatus Aenigmatarchaeota archaeon]